jgi:hypothetical protein
MEKTPEETPIWPAFREWVIGEKGLARRSAGTYVSHAKRIVTDLGDNLTAETLLAWIEKKPEHNRSAYRGAWRAYVAYMATIYPGMPLATFPRGGSRKIQSLPPNVLQACHLAWLNGASFAALCAATYGVSPAKRSRLESAIPALRAGRKTALTHGDGVLILPVETVAEIAAWALTGEDGDPLLPLLPGKTTTRMQKARLIREIKTWQADRADSNGGAR